MRDEDAENAAFEVSARLDGTWAGWRSRNYDEDSIGRPNVSRNNTARLLTPM